MPVGSVFQSYLEAAVVQSGLELSPEQVQKCHKLYHILMVRHGTILLGPTGGGKSTIVTILKDALNRCHLDYYGPKRFLRGTTDAGGHTQSSLAQVIILHSNEGY